MHPASAATLSDLLLQDLCELAGAETLPADAVCRLLRTALNLQWTEGVEVLSVHLQAAEELPGCSVQQLLESAIQQLDGEAAVYLLGLKGAQELQPQQLLQLLQLALRLRLAEPLDAMCRLQPAWLLSASQIEETLDLALRMRACGDQAVVRLLDLPGAQQLSSSSVSLLLQQAGQHGAKQAVVRLCELPGAQHLGPDAAAAALSFGVVEQLDSPAIVALSGLPGAQQLPASAVAGMLRSLMRRDSYSVPASTTLLAQQLLQLPAAAGIPADEVTELLQLGSQRKMSAEVMQQLFTLHAAAMRRPHA